jgi:ribosome maturation factor RimP
MYRDIPPRLLQVVEPIVRDHGLEVVDARVLRGGGRAHLRLVVDTPEGDGRVLVDTCAAVSREVGHGLDAADVIEGSYLLEVTSPGIDRVLARERDFERAIGRRIEIETREPIEGRRRFKGVLTEFETGIARLELETGPVAIAFENVARARAFHPLPGGGRGKR